MFSLTETGDARVADHFPTRHERRETENARSFPTRQNAPQHSAEGIWEMRRGLRQDLKASFVRA